jgi:hypothetical protein
MNAKESLKERLKVRFGDKYLDFMQDLSNINLTCKYLSEKWTVSDNQLARWVEILGYSHTFGIKQKLRVAYRIARRVKQREETAKQILNILAKRNS